VPGPEHPISIQRNPGRIVRQEREDKPNYSQANPRKYYYG
jgi:hypothetical protein